MSCATLTCSQWCHASPCSVCRHNSLSARLASCRQRWRSLRAAASITPSPTLVCFLATEGFTAAVLFGSGAGHIKAGRMTLCWHCSHISDPQIASEISRPTAATLRAGNCTLYGWHHMILTQLGLQVSTRSAACWARGRRASSACACSSWTSRVRPRAATTCLFRLWSASSTRCG